MHSSDIGTMPPAAPLQAAPSQAAPLQAAHSQAVHSQAVNPQAVHSQAATPQTANPQAVHSQTTSVEILADTLLSYGYKVTEANKEMLKLMLENGIPLTKENIQRVNQALKLSQSPDKALFLLQNKQRLTQANAAQLENLVSGQAKITNQLSNLLAAVEQLEDPALASQLKQILAGNGKSTAQKTPGATHSAAEPTAQAPVAQPARATPQQGSSPQSVLAQSPLSGDSTAQANTPALPQGAAKNLPQSPVTTPSSQATTSQTAHNEPQTILQTASQAGSQTAPQPAAKVPGMQSAEQTPTAPQKGGVTAPIPGQRNIATPQSSAALPPAPPQTAPAPVNIPLPQNLLFNLEESTARDITRYLTHLRETLNEVRQALAGRETPDAARVLTEARSTEAQIDFTSQIRNQTYVQIPMFHNGQQTQVNLHVYKDAKKPGGASGDSASALIALETASMGHFETYVQKTSNAIHCQFRPETPEVMQLVRNNIHKLNELLRESGYSLESFSFLPPGEPYTVLDSPKTFDAAPAPSVPEELPRFDKQV
ncbi:MAG: flagellar hook-length control protein FliK [Defluviitaleaceae bacterium]|nr:flagellar hook-length control protein FliK [Defluviitaleaceae bacterium]